MSELLADGEILAVRGLSKAYGAVQALTDVSFSLGPGQALALLGDNGAGKSTLVKILSGVMPPDAGVIEVDGSPVMFRSPHEAKASGIETVFQELMLVGSLNVAANLYLNREIRKPGPLLRRIGWLDWPAMERGAEETLSTLHITVPSVRQLVERLSGGQRQSVAVSRAVAWGRHIVLMDEPAAALGVAQSRQVLDLVRRLRESGVALVFITHNLGQAMEVCDRAMVLRHGRAVADVSMADVTSSDLVDLITGSARPQTIGAAL